MFAINYKLIIQSVIHAALFVVLFGIGALQAQETISYQGRLADNSMAASGVYDFKFQLFSASENPVGAAVIVEDVAVTNGIFSVRITFPADTFQTLNFETTPTSMQIAVRPGTSTGTFTTLAPAQRIDSAPYSFQSGKSSTSEVATTALNSLKFDNKPATDFVQTNDLRLSDSRNPLAGSSSYIQNRTTIQPGTTNFNINGNGTLSGTLSSENASIANNLSVGNNLFAEGNVTINGTFTGSGAGLTGLNATNVTGGTLNDARLTTNIPRLNATTQTFSGTLTALNLAATNNLSVQNNVSVQGTITGNGSGLTALNAANISSGTLSDARLSTSIPRLNAANTFTGNQTFSGSISGAGAAFTGSVTAVSGFSGSGSGLTNLNATNVTTGTFGDARLSSNIPRLSAANEFSGTQTANIFNASAQFNINSNRILSAPGTGNLFAGIGAGASNTGLSNSFFGGAAGSANTSGNYNSFFGYNSGTDNSTGASNSFFGTNAGNSNQNGGSNTFVGANTGFDNTSGSNNTFIGFNAGGVNTTGSNNTIIGAGASLGADNLNYATVIGAGAVSEGSNSITVGRVNSPSTFLDDINIYGKKINFSPYGEYGADSIGIYGKQIIIGSAGVGFGDGKITIRGKMSASRIGIEGFAAVSASQLCYAQAPVSFAVYELALCGSSIRYKKNVDSFTSGLSLIRRLRPVAFNWISNNERDLGFIAEEVNAVEPLLTTFNEKGEIQGVKYDRISVALVNAANEQQTQIETQSKQIEAQQTQILEQQKTIERQQKQIDALLKFVCAANPMADVCNQKK